MPSQISIRPVIQFSELEGLGVIQEEGLKDDGIDQYARLASTVLPRVHFQKHVERNFSEGPEHIAILRAIEEVEGQDEKVVGFATWYFGKGAKLSSDEKGEEGSKEQGKGEVIPVVPPEAPTADPTEFAEVEKSALTEEKVGNREEEQKAKQKRRIERAARFLGEAFGPDGDWYRKLVVGKEHIYLRQMYVLPSHQGRGIASQFMRWGCDKADQNGWPGFLISTPMGRPVYQKYGWYDEQCIEIQKPDLDIEGKPEHPLPIHKHWIMLRNPRTA